LSSRSSNSDERELVIGRVSGFRGPGGEITVRVVSGDAERWTTLRRARFGGAEDSEEKTAKLEFEVEAARAYRDRLVLKLRGVDDPSSAQALRGRWLVTGPDAAPELPADRYYVASLVGLDVHDEGRGRLGTVIDVIETSGTDVLVVEEPDGHEVLVPMAKEIVTEVRVDDGRMEVRLPEGLRELNRREGRR
jgi:16S rRNA processing protein RimM